MNNLALIDRSDPAPSIATNDAIVLEARKRFDRCSEWEGVWRQRFLDDIRFANGDSDNGFQWPNDIRNSRDANSRPCLTMNLIAQHNNMISNQARKNKSTVKYVGVGNGATQESANVFRDLHRYIEYQSQAQSAYTLARQFQIEGGLGWFRLTTQYEPESFDQDIYIEPVLDPLSIFLDPDIKQKNGSDANFGLVFDDVPREEFFSAYPRLRGKVGEQPLGIGSVAGDWNSKWKIRVCEYFRKVPKEYELVSFVFRGQRSVVRRDKLNLLVQSASARRSILDDPQTKVRETTEHEVEWYLIAGEKQIDHTVWPGKYIPLIRVLGVESVIEGILDRKGHTRAMKDAQRMFNYNASGQVEFGALQSKTPWIAAAKAIEEHESVWASANTQNPSVLPFNHVDPEGSSEVPIPAPMRIDPPNVSPAFQVGMETASNHIMMVSGQYQNQMGEAGNERTGAAINGRQAQSETANFHFQDNYEDALVFLGKQIIDLATKVYDTKRIKQIKGDDGIEYELEIDPTLREGYLEKRAQDGRVIKRVFNPNVGKFDIAATVGPDNGTKRQETRDALTLILTQAPTLTGLIGDLLMKSMDFEDADEAALRLRRMIPPQALGKGPTHLEQQQQQQISVLMTKMQKLLDKNAKDSIKLQGKAELRDIEVYDAETKRMAALAKMLPEDPEGLRALIEQLVHESLSTGLNSVLKANSPAIGEQSSDEIVLPPPPPVPGANRASDGEWYLTDPTRKGKYLHVAPLAQEHSRPGVINNV